MLDDYLPKFLPFVVCSFFDMGQVTPATGGTSTGASKTQSAAPVSSGGTKMQTGKDYDFSSLTQGMFSKH